MTKLKSRKQQRAVLQQAADDANAILLERGKSHVTVVVQGDKLMIVPTDRLDRVIRK